ncbi:glycoside hydrolase [Sorangium sp. So ce1128]
MRISPDSLEVLGRAAGSGEEIEISAPSLHSRGAEVLSVTPEAASFRIPDLDLMVEAELRGTQLAVRIRTSTEQTIEWPKTATGGDVRALVVPVGEGLYLPVRDPFWLGMFKERECFHAHGGISMPFWATEGASATATYILASDIRSALCLGVADERMVATATHRFLRRDQFAPYDVVVDLAPGAASPIAAARRYRSWLESRRTHVPFSKKVKHTPEAEKLLGALHVYLWGDGRTTDTLDTLKRLGVERAVLIYDQGSMEDRHLVPEAVVRAAQSFGYLIGPYTTVNTIQDPRKSDDRACVFDAELFRNGAIVKEDGSRQLGFGGRGFGLSSEALKRSPIPYLQLRVDAAVSSGANAYFLDSDAFGDLADDFDPTHPMTAERDRQNRMARMLYVSQIRKLVVGSESAAGWSTSVLHYSHGTETPETPLFWKHLADTKRIGGWWPPERPTLFFKEIDADEAFATAEYDPRYRVPLYQAVFHDSIVSTDRWEMSLVKYRNLVQVRSALGLLYGVPSLWNLDQKALSIHGARIRALYEIFGPLHQRIGQARLDDFTWLTPDRSVQRTRFGDVEITANFGDAVYEGIKPTCVEVRASGAVSSYCPAAPEEDGP